MRVISGTIMVVLSLLQTMAYTFFQGNRRHTMDMMGGDGGMMILMIIVWILVITLLVLAIIWLFKQIKKD